MSDSDTGSSPASTPPTTIAQVLDVVEPMGDLTRFVVDDLAPEEEDAFFAILANA